MPVEFRDYYDVLGVARDASDAEIKTAFRALARKHHPDVAKNKVGAENRFKEINEANEVLGDPHKRRRYDELGATWNEPGHPRAGSSRGSPGGSAEGAEEFHFDGTGFSDFFEQFFGSRGRSSGEFGHEWARADARNTVPHRGQDIVGDILVTLDEVLRGSTRTIRLQRTDPLTGQSTEQTLRVRIPAGVRDAQMIRLAGKGGAGTAGGNSGNLFLRVAYGSHPEFRVRGADLYHELDLSPWEAVLGAAIQIPTLDGNVSLKIPPGSMAGRDFRLRGLGLPGLDGVRGDLHAMVSIHVPPITSPEQKTLWRSLAASTAFNPRRRP